jgi:hypothetical protein
MDDELKDRIKCLFDSMSDTLDGFGAADLPYYIEEASDIMDELEAL